MPRTLIIGLTVAVSAWTAYLFFFTGGWMGGAVFGVLLPLAVLLEWHFIGKPSADARVAADRMMFAFLVAMVGIATVLDNAHERELELEAECIPRTDTATEAPDVTQGKAP